jgi:hypothetical protein
MAECVAQCLNLEHEFHDTASERGILGLEPLKVELLPTGVRPVCPSR